MDPNPVNTPLTGPEAEIFQTWVDTIFRDAARRVARELGHRLSKSPPRLQELSEKLKHDFAVDLTGLSSPTGGGGDLAALDRIAKAWVEEQMAILKGPPRGMIAKTASAPSCTDGRKSRANRA